MSFGEKKSIHLSAWPKYDPKKIVDSEVKIAIQINGKVRAEIQIDTEASEQAVEELVKNNPEIIKSLDGREIKKIIYIKGRIVSLVV